MKTKQSRRLGITGLLCLAALFVNAQITITLQPNASRGKDALLTSLARNTNYSDHADFSALAWTNRGSLVHVRALLAFDLSEIPIGAVIEKAYLSLYSYKSPANGAHSTRSGSNKSVLQRVTSPWEEHTVTWNTQPSTTAIGQVYLPASRSAIQNYEQIEVSQLVQDMVNSPGANHGFMLRLAIEEVYRSMIFASSDHLNGALHPKLEVTFSDPVPVDSCVVFQARDKNGKDAALSTLKSNTNYGDHAELSGMVWTNRGVPVVVRSLLAFDLSSIPVGAEIVSANLSLYSYESPANGSHSTRNGTNACVIQRVTSTWEEHTVTWKNQPTTTEFEQVLLPASLSNIQNYEDIDVRALVQKMVDNPSANYGFMLRLFDEQIYRKMIFASSDNKDESLHPRLRVCYNVVP